MDYAFSFAVFNVICNRMGRRPIVIGEPPMEVNWLHLQ